MILILVWAGFAGVVADYRRRFSSGLEPWMVQTMLCVDRPALDGQTKLLDRMTDLANEPNHKSLQV